VEGGILSIHLRSESVPRVELDQRSREPYGHVDCIKRLLGGVPA
jgi:hypothetical protein